jgi:hypothetical protein
MKGLGIGRTVHYVAFGTPGGEYEAGACRAALITEVHSEEEDTAVVSLLVVNPTGIHFRDEVRYNAGNLAGTWHWPELK